MNKIKTLCIIDDDPIYVYGAKFLLQKAAISEKLLTFKDGRAALDTLSFHTQQNLPLPELILLDLNMPIMDGWQFLEAFYKLIANQDVAIYVVSSSIDPTDYTRALSHACVSDFIVKPITKEKIDELLSDYTIRKSS